MFTRLRLKNFKAWKDTGDVALKPLTLLLGTNSSGKSSLIQSLLLLRQTVLSPDPTIHLNLGGDEVNDLFNFGDFDDVLFQGIESPRMFSIGLDFTARNGIIRSGNFECDYVKTSSGSVAVQKLRLADSEMSFRAQRREKGAYSIFVDDEPQPRIKGRDCAPERSIAFPEQVIHRLIKDIKNIKDIKHIKDFERYTAAALKARSLSLALRRELQAINYLGPLRRKPERDYPWNKTRPSELGADGRSTIDVLLASELLKGEAQGDVIKGVSKWLRRMGVAQRLEVRQQGRSNRYALMVHRDGIACNLRDVGIGISQVLPVLVEAHFATPGSTIILEEPEIHLHPLAQSVLAELFIEISQKRKVQFIVETHSEHLFRRLQTLAAQEKITSDHAALYFVEHDSKQAILRKLEMDTYGRVQNWPKNFFGNALEETAEQARLLFERMAKTAKERP